LKRPIVTTVHVKKRTLLRIAVRELAPLCRSLGTYRYTAFPGRNRLRLPKRVHGTHLGIGRYALVGKTARGRTVFHVVATLRRRDGRLLARVKHAAATCNATMGVAGASLNVGAGSALPGSAGSSESTPGRNASGAPRTSAPHGVFKPPSGTSERERSPLVRAATLNDAPLALRPLLYALLAAAIGLLAAAAMPNTVMPAGAAAAFVARRRAYIAAAGIWLLVVVAVIAAAA
jgi:hypothetical protein